MSENKRFIEHKYSRTLEVDVYYSKGGMNYFTGSTERRGYYISVSPINISRNEQGQITSTSYTAFSGVKKFLLEVTRKSPKAMVQAIELAKLEEEQLIAHVVEKNNLSLLEVAG